MLHKICLLTSVLAISNALNVAFYNTNQERNMLESVNDISGNSPPAQQTAQIEELKRESSELALDVLCLSNLYTAKQLDSYRESLSELYPYSFSQLDVKPESDFETPRTPCTAFDYLRFESGGECTQEQWLKCDEVLRAEGTNVLDAQICLAEECPLNMEQVQYSECKACLNIFTEANNWDPDAAGQAVGLAMYACSMPQDRVMNFTDGVMILSKHEIKWSMSMPLPSFIFHEQRLNMVQVGVDDNDVLVSCLSMNPTTYKDNERSYVAVSEQQRNGGISSHVELNQLQIEEMMKHINYDYVDAEAGKTKILMGDLGVGETWNVDNFYEITYEGFDSYGEGACTFCVDQEQDDGTYNALAAEPQSLFDSESSKDLDHILLNDASDRYTVQGYSRFMSATYQAENGEQLPYSSRWGVVMQLTENEEA